jgi:hypothetical protein
MHSQNDRSRRRESPPARTTTRRGSAELSPPLAATRRLRGIRARRAVGPRATRARLAMLGIPLAMAASVLAQQVWAVPPLAVCAWWWAPSDWAWYWLVALGRGLLTALWANVGASAFAAFPDDTMRVGILWAAWPAVAALSAVATPADIGPARHTRLQLPAHRKSQIGGSA